MAVARREIPKRVVGRQVTIPVRIVSAQTGQPVDLTGKALLCNAKPPTGAIQTPTFAARTQTGDDLGYADITIGASAMNAAGEGEWLVDVFMGDTGGAEELLQNGRMKFTAEAKETF